MAMTDTERAALVVQAKIILNLLGMAEAELALARGAGNQTVAGQLKRTQIALNIELAEIARQLDAD
jgi:hypothetical protein